MKKLAAVFTVLVTLVVTGGFFSIAKADTVYSRIGGPDCQITNPSAHGAGSCMTYFPDSTYTGIDYPPVPGSSVTLVNINVYLENYSLNPYYNRDSKLHICDSHSNCADSTTVYNAVTVAGGVSGWHMLAFYFEPGLVDADGQLTISFPQNSSGGNSNMWGGVSSFGGYNNGGFEGYVATGGGSTITSISFQQPQFRDNFVSPDFSQWWNCVNIPASSSITGYYYTVTTNASTTDSMKLQLGIIPHTPGTAENICPLIQKQASSTPGSYTAQAHLYDQSDNNIANSEIINYTITSGTSVQVPTVPGNYDASVPKCGDTSYNYLGLDFGKMLCDVGRFLFVPSDGATQTLTNSVNDIKTKAPISYFQEISNDIYQTSSTTASSIPAVIIQTSSTSSVPNLNITLFSSSTVASATSRPGFGALRTMANVLLYVGFGVMCYNTAVGLFGKDSNTNI